MTVSVRRMFCCHDINYSFELKQHNEN